MAELLAKIVQSEGIYIRTEGVWAFDNGPVLTGGSSGGAIVFAPDGHLFVVDSSFNLWERTAPNTWSNLGGDPGGISDRSKFFAVSKDLVWLNTTGYSSIHATRWQRGVGFTGETFPAYAPVIQSEGAVWVLPGGEVLLCEQNTTNTLNIWRRTTGGVWSQRTNFAANTGCKFYEIFSPDGTNVWAGMYSSDTTKRLIKSTDGGLTWGAPFNIPGNPAGAVVGIRGTADNSIYVFYSNGLVAYWNGSTWTSSTPFAAAIDGATLVASKPVYDNENAKNLIYEFDGSWASEAVTGAGTGSHGPNYATTVAGIEVDTENPRLQDLEPRRHENAVAQDTKIDLSIVDDQTGVVAGSVILTVNGVIAWSSDAQQNSFVVSKTVITNGFHYEITPPANLPVGVTSVRVQADDGTNTLDETYHFFVDRVGLLDDHFGGLGVNVLSGNGTISSVNGRLKIEATAGQNMDWYTSGRNGKIGVVPFDQRVKNSHGVLYFETELYSWSTTSTSVSHTMWGLYLNDQNFYMIYTHDGTNWNAYKVVNNGWTFVGAYSGNPVAAPPTRLRFKWDRINKTIAWQIYDSGWQNIVTEEAISFTPDSVFFGQKNWSSLPAITSEYEELFIYAEDIPNVTRSEKAQVLDTVEFNPEEEATKRGGERYMAGPAKYNQEFGAGVLFPGPPQQQSGSVGPFDNAGAFDQEVYPESADPQHHAAPIPIGFNIGGLADRKLDQHLISAVLDDVDALLGTQAPYNDTSTDSDFNAHFIEKGIRGAFYYNTAGEPWTLPGPNLLTGYGRDGYRYTAGLLDAGPVQAPWASEGFSTERGNRDDFPERALIVWTDNAVTIFDVTNFPTNLAVWMRFLMGDSGNYYILGRGSGTIKDVKMSNGVMYVAGQQTPWETGRMMIVDFKGDTTANTGHLIGPDNHWRWNATIVQRNSANWTVSGVSPSLRIDSEYNYDINAYREGQRYWIAVSGEDNMHIIEVDESQGSIPYQSFTTLETDRPGNIGDARNAFMDEFGWLWHSEYNLLVRNARRWQECGAVLELRDRPVARGVSDEWPVTALPHNITQIVAARDYVYCATEAGIYRVKRGTLEVELAYTVVGGGGGGRLNSPPLGELLPGDSPEVLWLGVFNLDKSSYLSVATYQGVATIRLFDDVVTQSLEYPSLYEHRARFNTSAYS